ncbi:bifunctional [glutamine synthetase] adenylyltransferase/[glutamine synthetase]-adenylyl-L-tyrosine phosphorylase [Corynebacterium sp.]|uniref:bifunctional [glutamine synthetase] adenylyltransferase/[glutamine synthetase]-adenylyl-L-tyrosine phosphorylase n=1 Tax=Corynebacterium sp. TaxID=1720 RepID=UPI0025894D5F|nr:bifunctional [glutamine synthetase] adenylyltransferase/[glutamine synthetase]-adenylyl-L-tyrosine phosphorylase [Corynebacterium sp.]
MTRPRSSRSSVPNARSLGLTHPKAQEDLQRLGWVDTQHAEQMWTLAATGDPDLALNNLIRLVEALGREDSSGAATGAGTSAELLERIAESRTFAVRLLGLFGSSSMLGDHIVANPAEWKHLENGLPTADEMMQLMLDSVKATHVEGASQRIYRAGVTGSEADDAMRRTYRTILARIAAVDVASTFVQRGQEPCDQAEFEVVARSLSDAADAALTAALAVACAQVYDADDQPARLSVLAMGKCGAQELNYISDVDVIFVAEPADPKATRWAGEFVNIGTRVFFEVDAALRPEGKSGALVRTLDSHVKYYNRWAETWEFQAQLKARPMTGDMELGQEYVDSLASLVWSAAEREDFVPDVQAMRRRVIENIPDELRARELKLGPGGLRDIEFAVQLLQMVHGRTDESLRTRSTVASLDALAAGGYIGRVDCHSLQESYAYMRLLEHRLQLQRLKRTHALPPQEDKQALVWLGRTAGCRPEGTRTMDEQLLADVKRVSLQISQLHAKLFYRPLLTSVAAMQADTVRLSPEAAKRQLAALGYAYPDRAFEHLSALAAGSSRKAKLQAIILPTLLEWLGQTVDPDAGLLNYRKLSEAAHDYSWFLRLLRDENIVGKRLMHILGTSPYASELFLNSVDSVKVLSDGATGPKFLAREPQVVTHSLVAAAGRHLNPDKAIAVARSLRRAELARIAAADLLGFMDVEQVCVSLSWVWDAVLEAALRAEIRFWEDENVANAPARITVIGMGRLGGAELGYGSDADVMFVAQPVEGADESEALKWATSICDSVRTRLGRLSQDPPLDVDIDLRPEGRNGPVVRTLDSYRRYYKEWGETWEMQALLRATWIAGDKDLGIEFLRMIDDFRYPPGGVDDKVVQEVRRMKARVDSERLPRGADRKTHTKLGRGALTDVEWTVQLLAMQHGDDAQNLRNTSTLEMLRELASGEFIAESDADILREAWLTATVARNAIVLVKGKRKDQLPSHGDQLRHVAAAAHWPPEKAQEFLDDYLKKTRKAHRVVDRIFWGEDVGIDYGG